VAIDRAFIDWSGNCGNLTGAVGPFAISEGLVAAPRDGRAVVRIPEVVAKGAVVAVTVEKAGGASTPTLPTLAASDPV